MSKFTEDMEAVLRVPAATKAAFDAIKKSGMVGFDLTTLCPTMCPGDGQDYKRSVTHPADTTAAGVISGTDRVTVAQGDVLVSVPLSDLGQGISDTMHGKKLTGPSATYTVAEGVAGELSHLVTWPAGFWTLGKTVRLEGVIGCNIDAGWATKIGSGYVNGEACGAGLRGITLYIACTAIGVSGGLYVTGKTDLAGTWRTPGGGAIVTDTTADTTFQMWKPAGAGSLTTIIYNMLQTEYT